MRTPSDHKVSDVRTQVYQGTEAVNRLLQAYAPEIRALIVRQLMVDIEIQNTALNLMRKPSDDALPEMRTSAPAELTVKQVAERCHVSVHTVKNWLRTRKLAKTKAGGRTLIKEADIQTSKRANQRNAA
jgi:excisionase family DNA binding protein